MEPSDHKHVVFNQVDEAWFWHYFSSLAVFIKAFQYWVRFVNWAGVVLDKSLCFLIKLLLVIGLVIDSHSLS